MRPAELGALKLVPQAGDISEERFVHVLEPLTATEQSRTEAENRAVYRPCILAHFRAFLCVIF